MTTRTVSLLSDCTEFRQALQGRPPAVVHGAATLIVGLVATAIGWAACVEANVVVSASGRVRPIEAPVRVFTQRGTHLDGRVAEVFVKEGDRVIAGQIMFRLDTARLDNEIARHRRRAEGLDEQLDKLEQLDRLTAEQHRASESKALAELAEAEAELDVAGLRRESLMRQRKSEHDVATDQLERTRQLRASRVVAEEELVRAEGACRQSEESLRQASLPVDSGRVEVLRKALDNVSADFAARRAELETRRAATKAERDEVATELSSLLLERERSEVRSPIDGVVTGGLARAGDVLPLGKPAFEVAREEGFRFEALVASEDMGQLKVGMPVKLRFDAYDYRTYGTLDGEVCFLSPDSAPSEDESPSSSRSSKVHYVVRVDLKGDELRRKDIRGPVKLGLGGVAEVIVERASILEIMARKLRGTISLL